MSEDTTPHVDEIRWDVSVERLGDRVEADDVWPTVRDWCVGLQRALEVKHAQLQHEEATRRENRTETERVEERVARELLRQKRSLRLVKTR